MHGLLSDIHYLGFAGRWVGMRVLATPKGLDIHLFLSPLSFITIVGWELGGVP